eukprot:390776_1
MKSILLLLTFLLTFVSSTCNYAVVNGTKMALGVCITIDNPAFMITCSNDQFTYTTYSDSSCSTVNETQGPFAASLMDISDYSCDGTTTDCDLTILTLFLATSSSVCGNSSSASMSMSMPIWNGECDDTNSFITTSCDLGAFAITKYDWEDAECTQNNGSTNLVEGTPFEMDGNYICVELSADNICSAPTPTAAPTASTPTPTSAPTSGVQTIQFNYWVMSILFAAVLFN